MAGVIIHFQFGSTETLWALNKGAEMKSNAKVNSLIIKDQLDLRDNFNCRYYYSDVKGIECSWD